MKLRCLSLHDIFQDVRDNKRKIVMFGAGVIGQVTVPEMLREHDLLDYIDCYIDNDPDKWDSVISLYGRSFNIKSPEYLLHCNDNAVVFVNISRYAEVVEQLNSMQCTRNMLCYIMPMICIHDLCSRESAGSPVMRLQPVIPKKIHYMWIGGKQLPDNLQKCIESWKKYCPDYEIIEWNESNYDIKKNRYMAQAYECGAYGFVPDYARIDILYHEGGIYMDTDVELKRNIDDMLYQDAFCGVEKWQILNMGGCSGAVKGQTMLGKLLDLRKKICFIDDNGRQNRKTCGFYDTKAALENGYLMNGTTQCIDGMNIYAYDYFHPYDYMSGITNCTSNTHSIHHFNGGWLDEKSKMMNEKTSKEYMQLYNACINN